jgi:hypothetical protein
MELQHFSAQQLLQVVTNGRSSGSKQLQLSLQWGLELAGGRVLSCRGLFCQHSHWILRHLPLSVTLQVVANDEHR